MSSLVSFSEYDIFAYLMVGLATLAVSDIVLGARFLFRETWHTGTVTITVIAAYLVGHIVATPAQWVLEQSLVNGLLGRPSHNLMVPETEAHSGWMYRTVLEYWRPLDKAVQGKIQSKTTAVEEKLFWTAYPVAKANEKVQERLVTFSKLYTFSRNMTFVALLAMVAVGIKGYCARCGWQPDAGHVIRMGMQPWFTQSRWQLVVFAGCAVFLFIRYLTFYRLYSLEVLVTYAFTPAAGS